MFVFKHIAEKCQRENAPKDHVAPVIVATIAWGHGFFVGDTQYYIGYSLGLAYLFLVFRKIHKKPSCLQGTILLLDLLTLESKKKIYLF